MNTAYRAARTNHKRGTDVAHPAIIVRHLDQAHTLRQCPARCRKMVA
jgi:hypothetical protein